jgi:hypothetical protein
MRSQRQLTSIWRHKADTSIVIVCPLLFNNATNACQITIKLSKIFFIYSLSVDQCQQHAQNEYWYYKMPTFPLEGWSPESSSLVAPPSSSDTLDLFFYTQNWNSYQWDLETQHTCIEHDAWTSNMSTRTVTFFSFSDCIFVTISLYSFSLSTSRAAVFLDSRSVRYCHQDSAEDSRPWLVIVLEWEGLLCCNTVLLLVVCHEKSLKISHIVASIDTERQLFTFCLFLHFSLSSSFVGGPRVRFWYRNMICKLHRE